VAAFSSMSKEKEITKNEKDNEFFNKNSKE